ncbi:hypothetical protein S40293_03192 [Stachybotrys chartarum IBT 40293]|nr:hypothetical protein S40293_03192 [Stachybotrys chartarum IBT 40293]
MKTYTVNEPFLDLKCGLAESPIWEQKENVLRFVDIVNKNVYRVNLDKGPSSLQKIQYDQAICVTAALDSSDDSFLFGGKYGIGIAKKDSNQTRLLHRFWNEEKRQDGKEERMRANDGEVDSEGRFWVNTMCDPEVTSSAPDGVLFRLDKDGQLHRMITGVAGPNGMSWSKDDTKMYFTDTAESRIFEYDYDSKSGVISNKRVFLHIGEEGAGPDGHAQDEDGNLWVAVWGAWKVIKVSPQGEVLAEVRLPTRCVTAVGFAGEDIYITSEADPEPEKHPESARFDGGVFKCHVGVRGRPVSAAVVRG